MCAQFVRIPKRVLVVDDDLDLLMLLERRLLKEGFQVETAASLPEAEEIIPDFMPHLVLLDINVNGEDGRQLCWKLRHDPVTEEIKIMILSGFDVSIQRARLFGADDLLPKPLAMEYLLHRMDLHLIPSNHDEVPEGKN